MLLKEFRTIKKFSDKEVGFSDFLTYASMIDNGIILGKDGSLTAGFWFRGPDTQSSSDNDLNAISARLNNAFMLLDGGWSISIDAIKRSLQSYPKGNYFLSTTASVIDTERSAQYNKEGNHFESLYGLTLTYTPPSEAMSNLTGMLFDSNTSKISTPDKLLKEFKSRINDFRNALSNVFENTVRPMADYEYVDSNGKSHIISELLSYINFCITGISQDVILPPVPMYLDAMLAYDFVGGINPKIDTSHLMVLSINGLPQESYPTILDDLNTLGMEFRWNTRFICLNQDEAKSRVEAIAKRWAQKARGFKNAFLNTNSTNSADPYAQLNVADTLEAKAILESGDVKYGFYTSVLVFTHTDKEKLEQNVQDAMKIIRNRGFTCRLETINAIESYLGSLPAMGYYNVRKPLLHTFNLVHLLPTTGIWTGESRNPCDLYDRYYRAHNIPTDELPPLAYSATTGKSPFRFSLHYQDLGHTLVVGPTGSGKSVLLSFIMAQHQRYYNAQIFAFDKGYSSFTLNQACGGEYYDICGENVDIGFQPLANIDNQHELEWATTYILDILRLKQCKITPDVEKAVYDQLKLLSKNPREHRTFTTFVNGFSSVLPEASAYLDFYTLGKPGEILDSCEENIGSNPFQVFEMEHLMNKSKDVATPVLLYIFHLIEKRLDGRPTLLVLDEAWQLISDEIFREKIREWLKVLRKFNTAVVFATQSLNDIDNSPIRDVMYESCPTRVLLANPDAKSNESVQKAYANLGLTDHQIDLLSRTEKKRHYYYISPLGKRLIEFGFGKVVLSFIAVSDKERLKQVRKLIAEHGKEWPAEWLRLNGLAEWGNYWTDVHKTLQH